uniref:Cox3 n=1 Tax=Calcarina hispida TaxID=203399 RepID=UPI0023F08607|nr:Cox3 [Calcarina hispida]WEF49979.1 Cox3 [Calcarina hispida]
MIITYSLLTSLSYNLIYGIHSSYYSILISLSIENLFIICWLHFWYYYTELLPYLYFSLYIISYSILTILFLLLLWLSIILWLVDLLIESFIALSIIEQLSLIVGIKSLLLSELMLFFACFWCYINFRFIGSILFIFYYPLLSCYSFSIPFTNPLILLFSSLPIQSSQLFIKIGFLNYSIEGLGQSLSAGFYSIILQCKEFLYSYFSLSDCLIGSIHYLTTGLHGFHVLLGSFLFFIILFYIMFSITYPFYFMEFSFPLFLSSYYWHFVDFIWFLVFSLLIV